MLFGFEYGELFIPCISMAHKGGRALTEVRTLSEDLGCTMSVVVVIPSLWCRLGEDGGTFWILLVAPLGVMK